uniref:Uncharacterized protein n=1 Tax=viral metagenome TaxID=1070528 RepID=A0A6C0CIX6_9ZZZZ
MQLFFVDYDPTKAAQALSDVHVRKMPTEAAQLLSTAYRVMVPDTELAICKSYNPGGRIVKWLLQSSANFLWLLQHGQALCDEFEYRFEKKHASQKYIALLDISDLDFPSNEFSEPPLVMDQYLNLIVPSKRIKSQSLEDRKTITL